MHSVTDIVIFLGPVCAHWPLAIGTNVSMPEGIPPTMKGFSAHAQGRLKVPED